MNISRVSYLINDCARVLGVALHVSHRHLPAPCADPEFFVRGGQTLTIFVLVDEWWEDPNTTISGPSSARKRNAIKIAFRWRADDGPTLNAGSIAS